MMNDRLDKFKDKFKEAKKIKQILPAENWYMESQPSSDDEPCLSRLVCWAVCENKEGENFITGMFTSPLGILIECSSIASFTQYVYKAPQEG